MQRIKLHGTELIQSLLYINTYIFNNMGKIDYTGITNEQHTAINEVMDMFQKLNDEGITVILVTHSQAIAKFAKRTICMSDGQIVSGLFEGGVSQ